MNIFKYLLLMLATSEAAKSATADPVKLIGNDVTEPKPPVLFHPLSHSARTMQDSKPLWGVIEAASIQYAIDSKIINKLLGIPDTYVDFASSRTVQEKIAFFEKGAKYTPTKKTHQKNKDVRNRGLSDTPEMAAEIDQILLESPNGYAVLSIDPESKMIISGKIEERDDGTNSTTLYIIQGSDDPADPSYKITIIDRAAQLARTDNPDEEEQHTEEKHSRQLAGIPDVFKSGVAPKPGEIRVFTMRIYYSSDAISAAGGMKKAQAHAGQVVTDINFFLSNSGIQDWMQLKLQDIALSPVAETGDSATDLTKNAINFDRGGADFVMYITDSLSSCGRGYLYGAYYPTAENFQKYLTTVVKFSCSLVDKSAAHEFGHNLGGKHDNLHEIPTLFDGVEIFPYARALADQYFIKGTILAYINNKSARYPYFSSATGVYNGIKMGNANSDNVRAFKAMLEAAHAILHNDQTPPPTIQQTLPSKAPSTAATAPAPVVTSRPTVATQKPTVATKRPTVATYRPTKRPTKAPSKKVVTAPPTIDQTPTINENFKVGFSFSIPNKRPITALSFQVSGNRLITLSSTGISIKNSKGDKLETSKFRLEPTVLEMVKKLLVPGKTCQFEIRNTDANAEIYYVLPSRNIIKGGKKVTIPGEAKLLLQLDKKTGREVYIGDSLAIGTVGTPPGYVKFSQIKPINAQPTPAPTKKKPKGRMLEHTDQGQDEKIGQINFIEIEKSHNPEAEGQKLAQNDELMQLIASDWQTLYKFMVDSIVSLGPYDASKFFRSGVIQKLFSHASEENICGAFTLMKDDLALMALCKNYVPATITLDDQTIAALKAYQKFKAERPMPVFIRDVAEAILVSSSAKNMAAILNQDENLNGDNSAIIDMFKFADIKVLENLFTDAHTTLEQRNNYISLVSKEAIDSSPALKEIAQSGSKRNLRGA